MASLNDFIIQRPRPLPVIIAVDRSGSMIKEGKIDALNLALRNFITSIQKESSDKVDIQVALFSFGSNEPTCDLELTPVKEVVCPEYKAAGRTPLGSSLSMIKQLIEDKEKIPSRAYKPTVVLITDGIPTDQYQDALLAFTYEGRSSKTIRVAMAIGDDADKDMLLKFVSDPDYLISGENATDIKNFFNFVTMSVSQRVRSQTPDKVKFSVQSSINDDDDELVI